MLYGMALYLNYLDRFLEKQREKKMFDLKVGDEVRLRSGVQDSIDKVDRFSNYCYRLKKHSIWIRKDGSARVSQEDTHDIIEKITAPKEYDLKVGDVVKFNNGWVGEVKRVDYNVTLPYFIDCPQFSKCPRYFDIYENVICFAKDGKTCGSGEMLANCKGIHIVEKIETEQALKVKVGDKVLMKSGIPGKVLGFEVISNDFFVGYIPENILGASVIRYDKYGISKFKHDKYDVNIARVIEIEQPLEFVVGRFYKNRDGDKCKLVADLRNEQEVNGDEKLQFLVDGAVRAYYGHGTQWSLGYEEQATDIIGYWEEPNPKVVKDYDHARALLLQNKVLKHKRGSIYLRWDEEVGTLYVATSDNKALPLVHAVDWNDYEVVGDTVVFNYSGGTTDYTDRVMNLKR